VAEQAKAENSSNDRENEKARENERGNVERTDKQSDADKKSQSRQKRTAVSPSSRPPWSPLVLAIASLAFTAGFSSLWGGVMAGLNRRRLGDSRRLWLPLALSAVGALGALISYLFVSEAPWWTPPFIRVWMIVKYQLFGSLLWWLGPALELSAWAAIVVVELGSQRTLYKTLRSAGGRRASLAVPLLIGLITTFAAVNLGSYGQQQARSRLAEAKYRQGLEQLADDRYVAALEAFSQAIELAPDNADAHLHRARLLSQLGKPQDGLKSYDKVLDLRPNDVVARLERARLLVAMGKYKDAEGDCTFLLDEHPKQLPARFMRAVARFELQNYQQSLEDMNRALKAEPEDPLMHAYRGKIDLKLKRSEAAIEDFTKAMQGQPGDAIYYFDRALAHLQLNDNRAAIDDFTKAIELNPNDVASELARANAYLAVGETQQAIDDCDAALQLISRYSSEPVEQRPDLAGIYSLRARCRIRNGDYDAALEDAKRSLALDEHWADGYFSRGLVALALKQYDEAGQQFDKAVELSSQESRGHARALYYRARVHQAQGEAEAARQDREEALRLDPKVADVPALPESRPVAASSDAGASDAKTSDANRPDAKTSDTEKSDVEKSDAAPDKQPSAT
jgi:tetratricopeptide (TPR) repeat protein